MLDPRLNEMPWGRFREFIAPGAERFAIVAELAARAGLACSALEIAGNRHLLAAPRPPKEEFLRRPPVILAAHYDRAPGSPGANDNSAAVFLLIEAAEKLAREGAKNWLAIFTDKEELKPGESVREQGSYTLARGLKNSKMEHSKIFVFDACGVGDTLVISTTADHLLKGEKGGEKLRDSVGALRQFALDRARELGMAKALLAPTPFSADAGFFRAGLAAQTITMLPSGECARLIAELRRNPRLAESLVNAETGWSGPARAIPETWRSLNSPGDSHIRLTPEHFRTVTRFARALCKD